MWPLLAVDFLNSQRIERETELTEARRVAAQAQAQSSQMEQLLGAVHELRAEKEGMHAQLRARRRKL